MEKTGLNSEQVELNREKYGRNILTRIPPQPLWKKMIFGLKEPMIIILLVALLVQIILVFFDQAEWYDALGVVIAIIIANGVSAVSESSQENKALALKEEEQSRAIAKVLRSGKLFECQIGELVVGDIVFLQPGDKIAADGILIEGHLKVEQSALNGELEEIDKSSMTSQQEYDVNDLLNQYYVYRGTVVCDGEAYMEIKNVGDETLFGKLSIEVQGEARETPLQLKLRKLAVQISWFGYIGASSIIGCIIIRTILSGAAPVDNYGWLRLIINAITIAVTIIICAVPEGLPMLTSILLSLQSLKMIKNNVLVRKIHGIETVGSLNILFTDKTGTITKGKLSIVEFLTGDLTAFNKMKDISPQLTEEIVTGIGTNNSAIISHGKIIGGNSTDRALMSFVASEQKEDLLNKEEIIATEKFDSAKKYSSITIIKNGEETTYIKGAPENIIEKCTSYRTKDGEVKDLKNNENLFAYLDAQAERSMRLLAVAKTTKNKGLENLELICIISIRDNIRPGVIGAIKEVQNAGIQVVMVTGDRKETATAIAKDSKLITANDDIVITSAEMAQKSDEEMKEILPKLRVVARALPLDKSRLVRIAQEMDLVVGMTGDGVNDAPALKKADVGFAMGSGTEVAKEAGDIAILDDNFASIEKAILYGRTAFKTIRKFLIFQLTVNIAAVLTCFIGPLLGENMVMTVLQLLMINLVMDSLIAIAFGSEPTLEEYMKDKPISRSENIVNKSMFFEILTSSLYITFICSSILFLPIIKNLFEANDIVYLKSALFATFMMAITFNGFNARTESINPFSKISLNKNFIIITIAILLLQYLFVTYGGKFLGVEALSIKSWIICFVLSILIIPIGTMRKIIAKVL